ncbi:MAG: hypothetical protein CL840_02515 [Crocinitomicaceae bacterium]|nr:hypothetical protein [Crocinitomicaceae bacterium]|tara:strand:+ start:9184 stop:9669 length:486 start_codon:yes stop_codon:yes gene_type:complete
MINYYTYSEERLVFASTALVWDLLSNCDYLSKWMPYIISVEHLGSTKLNKGSILWVESSHERDKKQSLCYISECTANEMISFLSYQNETKVCFRFQISAENIGLVKILMTVEIELKWYRHILFRRNFVNSIKDYGFTQLNELDIAITEHRSQHINDRKFQE